VKRELGRRLGLPVGIGVLVAVTAIAIGTSGAGAVTAHDASAKKATGGGSHVKAKPPVRAALPAGAIKSIFVIELENESEQLAFGPSSPATYLNDVLRKQGELLVHYYATGHASLDNYISQISGQAPNEATSADCEEPSSPGSSTLVPDFVNVSPGTPARNKKQFPGQVNGTGCVFPKSVPTIANQLDTLYPPNPATHVAAWRDYDEDMGNVPSRDGGTPDLLGGTDCAHPAIGAPNDTNGAAAATSTTPADQYATRHNGFMFFHSIIDNQALCDANVVPLGDVTVGQPSTFNGVALADTFTGHLADDLRKVSTTPKFGWITPNLCDDGHDSTCAGPNTIGQTGAGAGGLHGIDVFLQHWVPLLEASPSYRSGHMLIVITFDESGGSTTTDGSACCHETPGPSDPTPGFSPYFTSLYQSLGISIPSPAAGGGDAGAVLLDPRYIKAGSVDSTGYYNHYSALRSYEDLLGVTTGGVDGFGHIGFAATTGLRPFGHDVFNKYKTPKKRQH
jgi:phosphatidylinositol-3-phosphatase